MYAGEMCYWHWQLKKQSNPSNKVTSNQSHTSSDSTQPTTQSNPSTVAPSNQSDDRKSEAQASSQSEASAGEEELLSTTDSSGATSPNSQMLDTENQTFDSYTLGKQFLQRYIEIVKGPLRASGWDYRKAEDMVKQLTG